MPAFIPVNVPANAPAIAHPPKHLVREYLARRARDTKPPPSPEEIRRQLGWGMQHPAFALASSRS